LNYTRFLLFAFSLIFFLSCGDESETENSSQPQNKVIPAVEAVQARFGSLPLVERFSGNVRSENQVPLYPQINARIEAVYVENGQYVEAGDILVKLNDEQLRQQLNQSQAGLKINEARLKQANAQLAELQSRFERIKQLADQELSSRLEFDQLQAELTSAQANVELVEAQLEQSAAEVEERKEALSRTLIKAPIDGTIGQRNAQVGMQVNTGTQLFLIGDLSKLRVEIILTENMLNKISTGQTATILVEDKDGNEQEIRAQLSRISPFLNEVTRSTEAEIDVQNVNGWLKPGMFVPVDIYFGETDQATLIPVSALYTDPISGLEGVFVANSLGSEIQFANDDSASGQSNTTLTEPTPVSFQPVNIIARGRMEVGIGGIESGKWIITIGQDLLSEGREEARVRTVTWEKVVQLQSLQREDLLDEVLKKRSIPSNTNL
jgi:RND family efflux transporter MFP subunit